MHWIMDLPAGAAEREYLSKTAKLASWLAFFGTSTGLFSHLLWILWEVGKLHLLNMRRIGALKH